MVVELLCVGLHVAPPLQLTTLVAVVESTLRAVAEASPSKPTKASETFADFASPVVTSTLSEVLAATMLELPPGAVTAPMTWPATPSPEVASALCVTVSVLLPSWRLEITAEALANAPPPVGVVVV